MTYVYMTGVNDTDGACSGSIISKNVILTAAHCVKNKSKIGIIYGHSNRNAENINTTFTVQWEGKYIQVSDAGL